jgi:hypothetical protein
VRTVSCSDAAGTVVIETSLRVGASPGGLAPIVQGVVDAAVVQMTKTVMVCWTFETLVASQAVFPTGFESMTDPNVVLLSFAPPPVAEVPDGQLAVPLVAVELPAGTNTPAET